MGENDGKWGSPWNPPLIFVFPLGHPSVQGMVVLCDEAALQEDANWAALLRHARGQNLVTSQEPQVLPQRLGLGRPLTDAEPWNALDGWGLGEVCRYFLRSETLTNTSEIIFLNHCIQCAHREASLLAMMMGF